MARQFILIGDHRQLPSVVLSEADSSAGSFQSTNEYRLSESLFEHLMVDWKDACPEAIVTLNEQYRMNDQICAIPRDIWYEGDLRPANTSIASARLHLAPHKPSSVRGQVSEILDPEHPAVFVDVPQAQQGEMPRTNDHEARLVRELVQAYLICGGDPSKIGVIAPFRAQVAAIRRALEIGLPEQKDAFKNVVDTVDRFQGQERELIIVSLASYGDFVHHLLLDERRLNVALTRAKHKLIILGDAEVLAATSDILSGDSALQSGIRTLGRAICGVSLFRGGYQIDLQSARRIGLTGAYTLEANEYNGERRLQLNVKDLRPAASARMKDEGGRMRRGS